MNLHSIQIDMFLSLSLSLLCRQPYHCVEKRHSERPAGGRGVDRCRDGRGSRNPLSSSTFSLEVPEEDAILGSVVLCSCGDGNSSCCVRGCSAGIRAHSLTESCHDSIRQPSSDIHIYALNVVSSRSLPPATARSNIPAWRPSARPTRADGGGC